MLGVQSLPLYISPRQPGGMITTDSQARRLPVKPNTGDAQILAKCVPYLYTGCLEGKSEDDRSRRVVEPMTTT